MKSWVAAKIHGIHVTDASVEYNGSVSICKDLMKRTNIEPFEEVQIVNLSNGARWTTYALPANSGAFTLNGGGARLGVVGDRCVIITYRQATNFSPAKVVFCDSHNAVREEIVYENP